MLLNKEETEYMAKLLAADFDSLTDCVKHEDKTSPDYETYVDEARMAYRLLVKVTGTKESADSYVTDYHKDWQAGLI